MLHFVSWEWWIHEHLEMSVGTYLQEIPFSERSNSGAVLVLYLRPSGRFLFAGYWPGYEHTFVIGHWSRQGAEIHLDGRGELATDDLGGPEMDRFVRVFAVDESREMPVLLASEPLKGWSLLSWPGPLTCVGQEVVNSDGRWLPQSLATVDAWIEKFSNPS